MKELIIKYIDYYNKYRHLYLENIIILINDNNIYYLIYTDVLQFDMLSIKLQDYIETLIEYNDVIYYCISFDERTKLYNINNLRMQYKIIEIINNKINIYNKLSSISLGWLSGNIYDFMYSYDIKIDEKTKNRKYINTYNDNNSATSCYELVGNKQNIQKSNSCTELNSSYKSHHKIIDEYCNDPRLSYEMIITDIDNTLIGKTDYYCIDDYVIVNQNDADF